MRHGFLLLAVFTLGLVASAPRVYADPITVILDNPNPTVKLPTSGSIFVNFTGSVSCDVNTKITGAEVTHVFDAAQNEIVVNISDMNFLNANNGGTIQGVLFTAEVSSATTPGLYQFQNFNGPAFFELQGEDALGAPVTPVTRNFTIRVAAVPEPATLLGMSSLLTMGGVLLRRQRTRVRHTA